MAETKKAIIDFGSINLYGTGKYYRAIVKLELEHEEDGKIVFSACGDLKTANRRGWTGGGQCLDKIEKHKADIIPALRPLWNTVYRLWKTYHLNDMHAGTPEQEKMVKEWKAKGNEFEYDAVCNYLKDIGMYEVDLNGEPYKYGHKWLYEPIPEKDLNLITAVIDIYGGANNE